MPAAAHVAVNAGQFDGGSPWGWHVENGRELQRPGSGPLAMALVVDSAGRVRMLQGVEVETARARGGIITAFQSYPAVLVDDGTVPAQLLAPGHGVDVAHRDARLGLGMQRDGRLVLVLTRFDALGEAGGQMPFGPTTPEMAALMGAAGCSRAVLLDGGLSAQLAVRSSDGTVRRWPGLRRVPLGLVVTLRQH
jgi:exopolysaccharide biosynthesis protein